MMFELLQGTVSESNSLITNITTSESFIILILVGVAGWLVQARLKSVFNKYSKVPSPKGMTGAEAAELMLRENKIFDVKVTHVGGMLTDHYNPATKTVNLSDSVYSSRSISAIAVACHECGHAIQHAEFYAPLQLRSAMVPIVNFSSTMAQIVIFVGIIILSITSNALVCWIGIGLISMSAIFSIVTLPVEFNASNRALEWLEGTRLLNEEEYEGAAVALRWAASTYVVAALSAIATILYYVSIINSRSRD